MLGRESKLTNAENSKYALKNTISPAPVRHFSRKRKLCDKMVISHSQPTPNTENSTDLFQEYKHQKALFKKHSKVIERHIKTCQQLLDKVSTETKLLLDIVNNKS